MPEAQLSYCEHLLTALLRQDTSAHMSFKAGVLGKSLLCNELDLQASSVPSVQQLPAHEGVHVLFVVVDSAAAWFCCTLQKTMHFRESLSAFVVDC